MHICHVQCLLLQQLLGWSQDYNKPIRQTNISNNKIGIRNTRRLISVQRFWIEKKTNSTTLNECAHNACAADTGAQIPSTSVYLGDISKQAWVCGVCVFVCVYCVWLSKRETREWYNAIVDGWCLLPVTFVVIAPFCFGLIFFYSCCCTLYSLSFLLAIVWDLGIIYNENIGFCT